MAVNVADEPGEDVVARAQKEKAKSRNPFSRIALFIRQVFGELRKVVTPTRKELWTYILVVLIFVAIMMGLVALLDWLFGWAVVWTFGDPNLKSS